jgi:hypothetical protein
MAATPKLIQVPSVEQETRTYERHLSPAQVGELWGLSADTVRRLFQNEPGVLVLANTTSRRGKRGYKTLRIPQHVIERVHRRLTKV